MSEPIYKQVQRDIEGRRLLEYVDRLKAALAEIAGPPIEPDIDGLMEDATCTYCEHSSLEGCSEDCPRTIAVDALAVDPRTGPSQTAPQLPTASDREKQLEEALRQCLKKIPYCEHEYTTREGAIWTFCESCGGRWADDEGAVPEPNMPKGMAAAVALLGGPPQPAPSPWRPISEAPRDHTKIIEAAKSGTTFIRVVQWDSSDGGCWYLTGSQGHSYYPLNSFDVFRELTAPPEVA